jgi:DNA segregation ATPase FtsK/SpoIIIE-like protein
VDSRVLLDKNGAEKLMGNGDAIIDCPEFPFRRFKGAYLSEDEITNLTANTRQG